MTNDKTMQVLGWILGIILTLYAFNVLGNIIDLADCYTTTQDWFKSDKHALEYCLERK